jgi:hypothetical protein
MDYSDKTVVTKHYTTDLLPVSFTLKFYFNISSTLMMKATCSSETSSDYKWDYTAEYPRTLIICCRVIHNALLLVFARDILYELINTTATPDWSGFCTRVTINVFTKAVSALYVRQFSPPFLEDLSKQVGRHAMNRYALIYDIQT